MQDFVYQDDPAEASGGAVTRRFVNFTGALVSTALVIGMGIWGYKLMVRDVSGIPVIEAIDGAFRTQPEEPGGLQTPHQGLQVNEIAAGGTASDPADEVRLAPEPIDLAAEDAPMGEIEPQEPVAGEATDRLGPLEEETATSGTVPAAEEEEDATGTPATELAVAEAMAAITGGESAGTGAASTIPRPAPRPDEGEPVRISATAPAEGARVGAGETAPEALAEGARLVQLGAFESETVAREHWGDVGARFAEAFADKRMVVQEAMSGGQPFYRLRAAGFSNLAEAESFCSTLLAGRADCIPVEVR